MPEGSPGQGRPSPLRSAGLRSLGAAGRIATSLPRPAPAARVHPAPAPGKVLDTPIYNPTAEEIFDINGVGKFCYQCFNMTQDWKTAYKAVEEPPPVRRRLQDVCYGYPEKIREALVKRVRMHLSKPKRSRGLQRSGREERMERMRRKKLTDLEREEEDEAKEKAKDLAWKNMEDFDEVAWLEGYLAGVKAKKDEALAHEKKLETLRKKAYGDAPPSY